MSVELATLDAPDDLKTSVAACVAWSRANIVSTPEGFQMTGDHLRANKAHQKQADDFFDPPIKQANELHKMLVGRKKLITDPLKESESIDKQKMLTYQQAEDAKRLAEQRRLQAEADERARREREALEKKAALAKKPETQQRYTEAAAQVAAPVVAVATAAPKIAGVSTRRVWRARVVDAALVPREFLAVDQQKLDGYARAMKEGASVPGVEFYPEEVLAASGR